MGVLGFSVEKVPKNGKTSKKKKKRPTQIRPSWAAGAKDPKKKDIKIDRGLMFLGVGFIGLPK
jgi:hypothetical protein